MEIFYCDLAVICPTKKIRRYLVDATMSMNTIIKVCLYVSFYVFLSFKSSGVRYFETGGGGCSVVGDGR